MVCWCNSSLWWQETPDHHHSIYKLINLKHPSRLYFDSDHKPHLPISKFCLSSHREQPQWRQNVWRTNRRGWRTAEQWLIELWRQEFFFLSPCHFWFGPHMYPWGMGMFIRGHFSQNTALCNECLCMFSLCIVFIFKRHFSCWYSHNPTNEKQKGSDFLSGSSNSSLWSNPP